MANALRITTDAPAKRNPMAGSLANAAFRARVVKAKAGRGSYSRKDKHKGSRGW